MDSLISLIKMPPILLVGIETVELLLNDLSIRGQFTDLPDFRNALDQIMAMRRTAQRYGREIHCHRNLSSVQVNYQESLRQVIQKLTRDQQRTVMQWLDHHGPFWDDAPKHGLDDYLECKEYKDTIVTDTVVGEAAYRCLNSIDTRLVSLIPSSWNFSPVVVNWHKSDQETETVDVLNYRDVNRLKTALENAPEQLNSWEDLASASETRCTNLTFSRNCFEPLKGLPFNRNTAQSLSKRLAVLDQFKTCFDKQGKRNTEGDTLYKNHFMGDSAWFSDSSETEKVKFRDELTFLVSDRIALFCPWHGKVNHRPPLRIHFSWPVTASKPLYIVYIGQKLTKR